MQYEGVQTTILYAAMTSDMAALPFVVLWLK